MTVLDHSASTMPHPEDLSSLLRIMNDTTAQLQATHETLQLEVRRLKSELADANARLRRSRELAALGEMAAGIAHEIRNPLGAIQLDVALLGDDLAKTDHAPLCGRIGRAVHGLEAIVRDVLRFAREQRLCFEPVDLDDLLGSISRRVAVPDVSVEVGAVEVDRIDADPVLLQQALVNVAQNAVEAVLERETRRVVLSAQRAQVRDSGGRLAPRIVLAVEDTGPGIPDDVVDRMFNPFFTTRATGTGLGLAIVHRIVDAHEGEVAVTPASIGGARVELRLPPAPSQSPVSIELCSEESS